MKDDYEQGAWLILFIFLCVHIATSETDAQILCVSCALVNVVVPYVAFCFIVARIASHLYSAFINTAPVKPVAFETIYPDSSDAQFESIQISPQNCF